jgi:Cft2 family RNA processing exonuclease
MRHALAAASDLIVGRVVLQNGLSRELFDAWCEDRRNGVIIADFAVQGTLAREILASPSHVLLRSGAKVCSRVVSHQIHTLGSCDASHWQGCTVKMSQPQRAHISTIRPCNWKPCTACLCRGAHFFCLCMVAWHDMHS